MSDSKEMLWYMAHPVSGTQDEVSQNIRDALDFLRVLNRAGLRVIAPWVGLVQALDDANEDDRAHGMRVDLEALGRCDGMIMVGPLISHGMRVEADHAAECGLRVIDKTGHVADSLGHWWGGMPYIALGGDDV